MLVYVDVMWMNGACPYAKGEGVEEQEPRHLPLQVCS